MTAMIKSFTKSVYSEYSKIYERFTLKGSDASQKFQNTR